MKNERMFILLKVIALSVLALLIVYYFSADSYKIQTLKLDEDYIFIIKAASEWEITQPIYCKVMKSGNKLFPLHAIGRTVENPYSLNFKLIHDLENMIVAIVEESNPLIVLAIYDLSKMDSWPSMSTMLNWDEELKIGRNLIYCINKEILEEALVLSIDVQGNLELKVR